jgi:TP901 family phage tail tape measure protein
MGSVAGGAFRATAAIGGLVAAFAGIQGASASIRVLADFGQEMSTVRAITGATEAQFQALSDEAQRLGSTTRFSASQAASGLTFLARAGFTADEAMQSLHGTLQLAQAGGLDLGSAADIASNVLTGFRLEVDQTARVVDVLALAANSANTNVFQLGEAMKFVAPVAAGLGVSVEEAAASIGALSDAGLQGSLAGTGLRRVLSELESPSQKTLQILGDLDVSAEEYKVSSVGLAQALERLADAGVDTGQALEIFGDRGGPAFEVLSSSIPRVNELRASLDGAGGTAQRVATIMDANLNGAMLSLRSATEGLILTVGEQGATDGLTNIFNGLAQAIRNVDAAINQTETERLRAELAALREEGSKAERTFNFLRGAAEFYFRQQVAEARDAVLGMGELRAATMQAGVEFFNADAAISRIEKSLRDTTSEGRNFIDLLNQVPARVSNFEASLSSVAGVINNLWAQALADGEEQSVALAQSVTQMAQALEMQRIRLTQGAEAAALYQAAIAKGSELTAAETQLIRENVRALEAATAAREDDERAQQRQQQMLSARLRNFMEIQRVQREMREEQEREAARNREGAERDFGGMITRDRAENPLLQLEDEYSQRLSIIREARENEIIAEEEYERRRLEMTRRYSAERNQIMLASASAGFGSLAQIIGAAAGETSAAYKVLFGISKGFAIAESVIAIQQAIAKALAVGFPANIPLMAQAAASGASIINTITSTQPGFADGGYVSGSGTGRSDSISARLSNGEFVVNSAATKSNRGLLEAINSGSSVGVKQSGGVQIYNYAPGVKHEAQIMDDGRIRVIAREEAAKVAPDAAAGALKDPNSRLSKSMTQNVNAPRRRL